MNSTYDLAFFNDLLTSTSWSDFHQAGDIILISSGGPSAWINQVGQTILSLKPASYSHVALTAAPGILIHSTFSQGVAFELSEKFPLNEKYPNRFKVFRYNKVENTVKSSFEFWNKSSFHFLKSYNKALLFGDFIRKIKNRSLYCSELVANVYSDIFKDRLFFNIAPPFTLPVHIESHILSTPFDWHDVTDLYIEAEKKLTKKDNEKISILDSRPIILSNLKADINNAKITKKTFSMLNEINALTDHIVDRIKNESIDYTELDIKRFRLSSQYSTLLPCWFMFDENWKKTDLFQNNKKLFQDLFDDSFSGIFSKKSISETELEQALHDLEPKDLPHKEILFRAWDERPVWFGISQKETHDMIDAFTAKTNQSMLKCCQDAIKNVEEDISQFVDFFNILVQAFHPDNQTSHEKVCEILTILTPHLEEQNDRKMYRDDIKNINKLLGLALKQYRNVDFDDDRYAKFFSFFETALISIMLREHFSSPKFLNDLKELNRSDLDDAFQQEKDSFFRSLMQFKDRIEKMPRFSKNNQAS